MTPQDRELLDRVFEELTARADTFGIRSLQEPERHILAAVTGKGVIDNGGFAYFYEGYTEIDVIAAAFEALEFPEAAEACRRSVEVFPRQTAFPDLEMQREWFSREVTEEGPITAFWHQLSQAVWAISDADLDARMIALIRRHPELFGDGHAA